MIIIGCDFHPRWQQIASLDTETGETGERKLMHADGEARQFYEGLGGAVRVGLESMGNSHWFVGGARRTGREEWIGASGADPGQPGVRKRRMIGAMQSTFWNLLLKDGFPRIWAGHRGRNARGQRPTLFDANRYKLVTLRRGVKKWNCSVWRWTRDAERPVTVE